MVSTQQLYIFLLKTLEMGFKYQGQVMDVEKQPDMSF